MTNVKDLDSMWTGASSYLTVPHTEGEYERLVAMLDELIDEVGEDESHRLASLMELVGALIEQYEDEHLPAIKG